MLKTFLIEVEREIINSMDKYPLFNSTHEGYAVILEELDELWGEVKKKNPSNQMMINEAVQVGAMAIKFILSIKGETTC